MKLLLDTHVFFWYINGDERLSKSIRASIRNFKNQVYLCVVSIWEAIVNTISENYHYHIRRHSICQSNVINIKYPE
jgi:PIN domain nuclease of toxin-antitoxin system